MGQETLCRKVGDALSHTWAANRPCCAASPRCPDLSGAFCGTIILRKALLTGVDSFLPTAQEGIKGLLSFISF